MYSRISHSRDIRAAILYARGGMSGKGHHKKIRNEHIFTVGLLPDYVMSYEDQCERILEYRSVRNLTEARRIILSFSDKEFSPDDANAPPKIELICRDLMEKAFDGFVGIGFIQRDGKGGKWHVHLIIPNCSPSTGLGFSDDQTNYFYLRQAADKSAANYIELDAGQSRGADKLTRYERTMRQLNDGLIDTKEKVKYIWKDDLRERISVAMDTALSADDFIKSLNQNGVNAIFRSATAKQDPYILYELTDTSRFTGKIPANLKSKSYKLGAAYGLDQLNKHIELNQNSTGNKFNDEPVSGMIGDTDDDTKEFNQWLEANGYSWIYNDGNTTKYDSEKYLQYRSIFNSQKKRSDTKSQEVAESVNESPVVNGSSILKLNTFDEDDDTKDIYIRKEREKREKQRREFEYDKIIGFVNSKGASMLITELEAALQDPESEY